jgi:hypothetical protein
LEILDDRDRSTTFVRRFPDGFYGGGMGGMSAVGKVQPGGIHAVLD